jgi:hypothetical protein
MATVPQTADSWAKAMRWSGRVLGLFSVGLFLLFLFESGGRVFPTLAWGRPQGLALVLALVAALVGVLVAWRWETGGGVVAIVGALAVIVLVVLGSGLDMLFPAIVFAAPLLLAGTMYLGCSARCQALGHGHGG